MVGLTGVCYDISWVFPFCVPKSFSACSREFTKDIYEDHVVSCVGIVVSNIDITLCVIPSLTSIFGSGFQLVKKLILGLVEGGTKSYVQLTSSSALKQTGMIDFAPVHAVIEAAQRKRVKYEACWVGPSGGVDGVSSVKPQFNGRRYEKGGIVAIVEREAHGGLGLMGGLLSVQTQSHIGRIIKLTYKLGGLLLLSPIGFRIEPQLGLYVKLGEMLGLGYPTKLNVQILDLVFSLSHPLLLRKLRRIQ
ncbi:hypothetical protein Tco_0173585 [Tanacetum coccineum]